MGGGQRATHLVTGVVQPGSNGHGYSGLSYTLVQPRGAIYTRGPDSGMLIRFTGPINHTKLQNSVHESANRQQYIPGCCGCCMCVHRHHTHPAAGGCAAKPCPTHALCVGKREKKSDSTPISGASRMALASVESAKMLGRRM